ncbi:TPA: hypothetical protein RM975_003963 [Escherichia coli]|nr:hypothetical protein [Escherichia coli]HDW8555669.1 hypothetical protein [Escherichia coli]HDW8654371.1 hypothetical protein [Escherichia coli]
MEVGPNALYQSISMLRKALSTCGTPDNIILTAPRRGFSLSQEICISCDNLQLTVINPTPYYFTPGQMNITIGSWQNKVYLGADKAVAPFSDKAFPLTIHSGVLPAGKATLHFSAIDDDGALQYFTYDLNRQKSLRFSG